jgi:uncharacterized protein (DUF2141 family)
MKHLAVRISLVAALLWLSSPGQAETLTVKLTGLRGRVGVVRAMIWKDAAGFPTQPEKSLAQKSAAVAGPELELTFSGLQRGTYAVAAYLDENNNGTLDRSIFGWPKEPTAASNGARGVMGPPSFAAASFELKQTTQSIQLNFK